MSSRLSTRFICIFALTILSAATTWSQDQSIIRAEGSPLGPTEVVLQSGAFFSDIDGKVAEIPAGVYVVSKSESNTILVKGPGGSYQIPVRPYEHAESVSSQLAVAFVDDPNTSYILLLDEDGAGLVAEGTLNGVVSRATRPLATSTFQTQVTTAVNRQRVYPGNVANSTIQSRPYAQIKPTPTACSDVVLDKFHASSDSNYPNNRLAMFTFAGQFSYPRFGSPSEIVVRIPDGVKLWSRVQFTFKTRLSGTENWQDSLSLLRPFAPALTQLNATQAANLGYMRSPSRPCFIKAGLVHPQMNRPYMIGASTWDTNYSGMELTFVDNEAVGKANNNESVPWSGGAVSMALLGFANNRPKAYNIEFWYFNDTGIFTKQSAFQIRIENCGRPPAKHGSGSYLLTCGG